MARKRNRKAHQTVTVKVDHSEQNKIKLDLSNDSKYDESNPLVLPSEKRKTKKVNQANPIRILSKKKRKKLEKIVEKKVKKQNREKILACLAEFQKKPYDTSALTSLQAIQTQGRKQLKKKPKSPNNVKSTSKDETETNQENEMEAQDAPSSDSETSSDEEVDETVDTSIAEKEGGSPSNKRSCEEQNEDQRKKLKTDSSSDSELSSDDEREAVKPPEKTVESSSSVPKKQKPAAKPASFKIVDRLPEVVEARSKLPVVSMEYEIMSAIQSNTFVIITGTTGSGKTTQVPQFLYEAGYTSKGKKIGITEPRRVAAISMAERVAYEMNLTSGEVAYQVRFEGNTTDKTEIKFMTDGTFLKEIQADPHLEGYSAIIIDEAHERSVNSDIIIGYLSRVSLKRGSPKVIIMSATLDKDTFLANTRLFLQPPPVVEVESRMFEVVVHHNRKTPTDYLEEAYKKVCQIHRQLPAGGILVFLTGKEEVMSLCDRLEQTFPKWKDTKDKSDQNDDDASENKKKEPILRVEKKNVEKKAIMDKTSTDVADGLDEFDGELEDEDELSKGKLPRLNCKLGREQPLHVLPMYALLEASKQKLIFEPPPEGTRLCVVATNIAETSLTIPNIVYVVDSGKIKQNNYDSITGVSHLKVEWTSQASANQRKGRAGRTQKGHCYRLYSAVVFNNDFPVDPIPDILRQPIEDIVLSLKSIRAPILSFPFPHAPPEDQIKKSIQHLVSFGALKEVPGKRCPYEITKIGERMSKLPVSPRFAKMMILSCKHPGLLPYVVLLVSILSTKEVLVNPSLAVEDIEGNEGSTNLAASDPRKLLGDLYVLLVATCDEDAAVNRGVRPKAMTEISKIRRQLIHRMKLLSADIAVEIPTKLMPPTKKQCYHLRRIVLGGSTFNIARKIQAHEISKENKRELRDAYRILDSDEPAYLNSCCLLKKYDPYCIIYQDSYKNDRNGKIYLRGVTSIQPSWIFEMAPELCTFSSPLEKPAPIYSKEKDTVMCHANAEIAKLKWELPQVQIPFPVSLELYKQAAYFFLEGEICPLLKPFTKYLKNTNLLIKRFAVKFSKERTDLTTALRALAPPNFKSLKAMWEKNPKFLFKEYTAWVLLEHKDQIEAIQKIWPPYHKQS